MFIFQKIRKIINKLQRLPDDQKKIIVFATAGIIATILGFLWIRSTVNHLSKINETGLLSQIAIEFPDETSEKIEEVMKAVDDLKSGLNEIQGTELSVNQENWKTYANSEYNYEIKHPDDWIVDNSEPSNIYIYLSNQELDSGIYINVQEVQAEIPLIQAAQEKIGQESFNFIQEEIVLGNEKGLVVCKDPECNNAEIFFIKNEYLYNLTPKISPKLNINQYGIIFYHIILSFKLL